MDSLGVLIFYTYLYLWSQEQNLALGSYEAYVRAVLCRACAPVAEGGLGYRAVVVNFRGCSSFLFCFKSDPVLNDKS